MGTATTASFTTSQATGGLPVIGHALSWLRDPQGFVRSLTSQGDLVRVKIGPISAVVVCHPELVHELLLNDRIFDKGGPFYDRAREFAGNGLVTCPYGDHRRQRRMMQPMFQRSRIPGYAAMMTAQIAEVVSEWREHDVVDVSLATHELAARIAGATMFGSADGKANRLELCTTIQRVLKGMYQRMLTPAPLDRLPTPGRLQYDRANARLRRIAGEHIAAYQRSGVDHGDLLSLLLAARDDDAQPLSEAEAYDQIVNIMVASIETMGSLLASVMYVLTAHPEVERRLHQEVDTVLAGRAATWEDIPDLDYTRRVVTETLRRYTPAWFFTRTTTRDAVLGGHALAAGTTLIYSSLQLHLNPDLYPDAEVFDPDRWPNDRGRSPRGEFIPFAEGARKCIGDTFAMTQAVLAVASIAARWRMAPADGRPVAWTRGATLAPRRLRVRLSARG
ncbi:cytochrome P450 [Kitasatospora sp. NPDC049285]|uniref:cytochrome P450 n=1 Tax=Kitasatospora sp. NPDC049285 TaxID=3157096 RepID=UPI0034441ECE